MKHNKPKLLIEVLCFKQNKNIKKRIGLQNIFCNTIKTRTMKFLNIKIIIICLLTLQLSAQQKLEKASQSIKANKDVVINLNTTHTDIEVDTWNKNYIEVEAYIESDKLTKEELKIALKNWKVNINGTTDEVTIDSNKSGGLWEISEVHNLNNKSLEALKLLEGQLADMPVITEMPELIVELESLKALEELKKLENMTIIQEQLSHPSMPQFPGLPELPEGISNVNFDYDKYKEEGEKYLEKWSKTYEKKYGKEYKEKMKAWAKEFSKVDFKAYEKEMEAWGKKFGEEFSEKFGKDYEKKMEAWGEKFGKEYGEKMEAWGKKFEKEFAEKMEGNALIIEERAKAIEKEHEKYGQLLEERAMHKNNLFYDGGTNQHVRKVIKIKMPKKAKLKLNVKHGELKMVSVIHNPKGNVAHATLEADNINGSNTSINVSYSEVAVNNWKDGELKLNYVETAKLNTVSNLILNSISSNVTVDHLGGNTAIDGSFGDLIIRDILPTFNNLNIVLENSDAVIQLPKNVNHNFRYSGRQSTFKHPKESRNGDFTFNTGQADSNKAIMVRAKYSTVIMKLP